MDYAEIYNKNMENYNQSEKHVIKEFIDLLSVNKVSDKLRKDYGTKLSMLLAKLNDLILITDDKRKAIDDDILTLYKELRDKIVAEDTKMVIDTCDQLLQYVNDIQNALIVNIEYSEDLSDDIKKVLTSIERVSNLLESRRGTIYRCSASYKTSADMLVLSNSVLDAVNSCKDDVKRVKLFHIKKYNSLAELANERIAKLKELKDINENMASKIASLELLTLCSDKGIRFDSKKYLEKTKFQNLIDVFNKINEIEKELAVAKDDKVNLNDAELKIVERKVEEIKTKTNDSVTLEKANELSEDINDAIKLLDDLRVRIINEKERKEYLRSIFNHEAYLNILKTQIDASLKVEDKIDDYQELKKKLIAIVGNIVDSNDKAISFMTIINKDGLKELEKQLDYFKDELNNIEKEILVKYQAGRVNNIQYQNLDVRLNDARRKLDDLAFKLQDPKMLDNNDTFGNLNDQIDVLDEEIDKLSHKIEEQGEIITNEGTKKKIDEDTDDLWKYVGNIIKHLDDHKEEDKKKYDDAVAKVEEQKQKLEKATQEYDAKKPIRVKSTKPAKEFYKKHKKATLIVSGIAALALTSLAGPVIIPAIMKGNMIIGYRIPALRNLVVSINKVLGASIGAVVVNHTWRLSNGLPLSVSVAGASLLKAIALVGGYSAAIVSALIIGVKKIINKMNLSKLKENILKIYESSADYEELEEYANNSTKKR